MAGPSPRAGSPDARGATSGFWNGPVARTTARHVSVSPPVLTTQPAPESAVATEWTSRCSRAGGRVKRSVPLDPSEDLGVVGEPVRVRTVVGEPGEAQRLVRNWNARDPPRTARHWTSMLMPSLACSPDQMKLRSRARVCAFRLHGAMAPLVAMLTFSAVSDFLANHE